MLALNLSLQIINGENNTHCTHLFWELRKYIQRPGTVSQENYQFLPFSVVLLDASVDARPWVQSISRRVCLRSGSQCPFPPVPGSSVVTAQQDKEGPLQPPDLPQDGVWDANSFCVPWPLRTHRTIITFLNLSQIQTRKQQEKSRLDPKGQPASPTPDAE